MFIDIWGRNDSYPGVVANLYPTVIIKTIEAESKNEDKRRDRRRNPKSSSFAEGAVKYSTKSISLLLILEGLLLMVILTDWRVIKPIQPGQIRGNLAHLSQAW
jgi:hypothetical protein